MKKWKVFMFCAFLAVFTAMAAQMASAETKLGGNLNFGYYTDYTGGMSGSLVFDDPVFQQSATLGMETEIVDFSGTFWSSVSPRGGFNSDFGDENDYMLDVFKTINGWRFGLEYLFGDMYRIGEINGDLHALCFRVISPPVKGVSFYGVIEKDWPTDKDIVEGGVLWKFGALYAIDLPFDKQKLNLDLCFGGNDGAYGSEPKTLNYGRLVLSLPVAMPFWKATLSPMIFFQKRFGDEDNLACNKIRGGLTFNIPF
ncbi:MAG: hypothetical protein PHC85_01780 [Candidatus Pacebacteria bacterium]|nr:hypothetical protein [Candidatus Paceibacterota bacterium]